MGEGLKPAVLLTTVQAWLIACRREMFNVPSRSSARENGFSSKKVLDALPPHHLYDLPRGDVRGGFVPADIILISML